MTVGSISSYTNLELALMCICGYLGNGDQRKSKLGSRYNAVQKLVDQILNSNKVPNGTGSGTITDAKVKTAVNAALSAAVNELAADIIGRVK